MAKKLKKTPELPFKSENFEIIWKEYITHRREKGASNYTPTGLNRVFNALIRDSLNSEEVAIKIIEQSLEKNWTGLFPLKNNIKHGQTTTTYWQRIGIGGINIEGSAKESPL
jgi:hypothetical protein